MRRRWVSREVAWASAVSVLSLLLFVATTRPDVGGPEDSPKFQFVGHVLGTAHSPGYPLYTLLTYAFTQLPIGNLAYRANLFSALLGAVACAGAYVLARQLQVSRPVAAFSAFALATTSAFWHNAVVAEVYTLAAALAVFVVVGLLAWSRRLERWRLYAACGVFAAGLGNHLTIVGLLPAALIYGVIRDRTVLSIRVISIAFLIGVAGIAQYAYIVWRTLARAPYIEARATDVAGIFAIMLKRDEANTRFQYSLTTLFAERVPMVITVIRDEMGSVACLLLLLGVVVGLRRQRADMALVCGAAIGMLALVVNIYGDVAGFVAPVLILLWPIAAVGVEQLRAWSAPIGRGAPIVVTLAASAFPIAGFVANQAEIETYRRTDDVQAYRALYARLPSPSAVVYEDFWLEHVINYLHFSGEFQPDPNPQLITRDFEAVRSAAASGASVFAFGPSVDWLRSAGLEFRPAEVDGPPLDRWIGALPRGTLVILMAADHSAPFEWLPADLRSLAGRPRRYSVATWTVGAHDAQLVQQDESISAEVRQSSTALVFKVHSDAAGSDVTLNADTMMLAGAGVAVMTVQPNGQMGQRLRFPSTAPLTQPMEPSIFQFDRLAQCASLLAGRPVDVSNIIAAGGWMTTVSQPGRLAVTLRLADAGSRRLQHRLVQGRGSASVEAARTSQPRLVLERTGVSRPVFELVTDAEQATATLETGGSFDELRVCRTTPGALLTAPATAGNISVGAAASRHFGAGWHDAERAGSQMFRWSERESTFAFELDAPKNLEFIWLARAGGANGATISFTMGAHEAGSCTIAPGRWMPCRIRVPDAVSRAGVNRLIFHASSAADPSATPGDRRELAFAIQDSAVRVTQPQ